MSASPRSGPVLHAGSTTRRLMVHVLLALTPAIAAAVWRHGSHALGLVLVALASAALCDALCDRRNPWDGGALVIGALVAMMLPVAAPWWLSALSAACAVVIGKHAFGGVGRNLFNPAAFARVIVAGVLPAQFFRARWTIDGASFATPLAKEAHGSPVPAVDLLLGEHTVSLAEAMPLSVLLGGLALVLLRTVDWRVPLAYLAAIACFALIAPGGDRLVGHAPWLEGHAIAHVFGGGTLLAAFFLVTDPVTMPFARTGRVVFVVVAAMSSMVIRFYSPFPDGAAMGVLIANILVPWIDRGARRWD